MYYDNDFEEEDDLQRMLEGRDVENEEEELQELMEITMTKKTIEENDKRFSKSKKSVDLSGGSRIRATHEEDDREDDSASAWENEALEDEQPGEKGDDDDEAIEVPSVKKAIKRRIVQNPRPKLDVNLLTYSDRGLRELLKLHSRLNFKGKGHEEEDLNHILRITQYWAHRLMPQMAFDDFVEKVESFSNKKPLRTFLSKLRLDMLEQPVTSQEYANDEDEFQQLDELAAAESERIDPEAAFDKIMEEDRILREIEEENQEREQPVQVPQEKVEPVSQPTQNSLSTDQLRFIAEKRLKALELRRKRLEDLTKSENTAESTEPNSANATASENEVAQNSQPAALPTEPMDTQLPKENELLL